MKITDIQFSKAFNSTQSDLLVHNGKSFAVIRKKDATEIDIEEVGNMYIIKLETGEELEAFEDEITEPPQIEEETIVKNIKVTKDNIEDLVDQWHKSGSDLPIFEYLGMSEAEYFKWVETDQLPFKEPVVLGTHNGTFHADDVFAYAILKSVFPVHELIRSRNPEELAQADIVFDVGGGVFDHHSMDKEYRSGKDGELGVPYASFGLIWREFGHAFLEKYNILEEHRQELFDRIDKEFIEGVDAFDNGVEMNTSEPVQIRTMSHLISDFNIYGTDDKSTHEAFLLAGRMAETMLLNALNNHNQSLLVKGTIIKAFEERENPELLVLPEGCNWKRTLTEIDVNEEVKFVIYPDDHEGFRIQVVTLTPTTFEARKDLPESWAGKRDEELNGIIGIDDAVFCHPGRFLAGAKSERSIYEMAKQALMA